MRLDVDSLVPYYTNSNIQNSVVPHYTYSVAKGHLPGNLDMSYTILDRDHLIESTGQQEVSIRNLLPNELDRLKLEPTTSGWYTPNTHVYSTQYPIDLDEYFRTVNWTKTLDQWVYESMGKDPRIVDCFKASVIPLTGEPTEVQPLNAHTIMLTPTQTGKTSLAYLVGTEPIIHPTEAGALGSYNQTSAGTTIKHGFLQGEYPPVFLDEINTIDDPIIQKLLTYLENGSLIRGLKENIRVEGTKTVFMLGNMTNPDPTATLSDFITLLDPSDETARMGRRFGFILIGNDYLKVTGLGDSSNRLETIRVLRTAFKQYRVQIAGMIESQMDWITGPDAPIQSEVLGYVKKIPIKMASDFVRGQSYSVARKLRTSALRYIILEQLDRVATDSVDFSQRETVFQKLLDINRDSWNKLASLLAIGLPPQEWARQLRREHPSYSYRDIAKVIGVSHTSVKNWLGEEVK